MHSMAPKSFLQFWSAFHELPEYLAYSTGLLAPDRVAVEFRHSSWLEPVEQATTLGLLASLGAAYVCVDEPRIEACNVLPPLAVATADTAYVRFHGRNAATWNARTGSAAERFKHLYSTEELVEWVEPVRHLQEGASTTYLMFNNCFADYAPRNAQQMLSLLDFSPGSERWPAGLTATNETGGAPEGAPPRHSQLPSENDPVRP